MQMFSKPIGLKLTVPKPSIQVACSTITPSRATYKADDFAKVRTLGRGSGGTVILVEHKETNPRLVLKVIVISDSTKTKEVEKEIGILSNCDCTGVIQSLGYFHDMYNNSTCLVLEYMDKGSLQNVLNKTGPIPESLLCYLVYQLLEGLAYLHGKKKTIHRDLKPSNILLNSDGHCKVGDFGVRKEIEETQGSCHTFVGTLMYMAPERLEGGKYTSSVDIWSLGLVVVECATGVNPYKTIVEQQNPDDERVGPSFWTIQNVLKDLGPPSLSGDFGCEMRSFVDNCLKMKPGDRPSAEKLLKHPWIRNTKSIFATPEFKDALHCWLGNIDDLEE